MRVGASINKRRIVDVCVAKGNDTRSTGGVFPIFKYSQIGQTAYPLNTASGELILRNEIKQGETILNTNFQLINEISTISIQLGDNQQRNAYPVGELELHQRMTRTQMRNIQFMTFQQNTLVTSSYATTYIDVSKFTELLFLRTLLSTLSRVTFLNLKNARKLRELYINNHNFTTLDISDNTDLQILDLGQDTGGNITTVIFGATYNELLTFNLSQNKLTSIAGFVAPNLTTLSLNFSTALGSITYANFPKLVNLNASHCGLTSLDLTTNVFLKSVIVGIGTAGNNNNFSNQVNISNCLDLEVFEAINSGLTALNLTNSTKLITLSLGANNSGINSNNLTTNLVGLYGLVKLQALSLFGAKVTMTNFNLELFAELTLLRLSVNPNLTGTILTVTSKPLLTILQIDGSGITFFDTNHTPNLTTLFISAMSQIDFTKLTRLNSLNYNQVSTGSCAIIDLSNGVNNMTNLQVSSNSIVTSLTLPSRQVTTINLFNCPNLSTLVVNSISRTNTFAIFTGFGLSVLDTSFGATNCFPNLVELAVGGGINDTYTTTKVYDDRKNNFTAFAGYRNFIVSGQLGIDTMAVCTFINIDCDADISYTAGSGNFGSVMRRVFLRPKIGSGLATSGNQVAELIIDLSNKTWSANATNSAIGINNSSRLIDLRGNCAIATPSTALTTALALLTTKGVTVLRN